MANKFYIGTSVAAIGQVDRFTPANVGIGDIFTLTATAEDGSTAAVSFTATAATVANVTAGLTAAWNASANERTKLAAAADEITAMTLTATTTGRPFSVASTTTDGNASNTQTLTRSVVTASFGPNDWNVAANWSDFIVPVSTDNVDLDGRATSAILYGLNQSAVTLAKLQHWASMQHDVGTSSAALRISATIAEIGKPVDDGSNPSGSALAHYDFGTNATTCTVWGSRDTGADGQLPVVLKGAHAANALRVYGGIVGVATNKPGDTAQFPSVVLAGDASKLVLAAGVTAPTLVTQEGGALVSRCAATTFTQNGGECDWHATATVTTMNLNGTTRVWGTGTITTLNIEDAGSVDLDVASGVERQVTTINLYGGGRLKMDPMKNVGSGMTLNLLRGANSTQVEMPDTTSFTFA